MQTPEEVAVATKLDEILRRYRDTPVYRRLRLRLGEHERNELDEPRQFRELQKAARESAELARDLEEAGFGDVASMDTRQVEPLTGALIQGFNRYVELNWR